MGRGPHWPGAGRGHTRYVPSCPATPRLNSTSIAGSIRIGPTRWWETKRISEFQPNSISTKWAARQRNGLNGLIPTGGRGCPCRIILTTRASTYSCRIRGVVSGWFWVVAAVVELYLNLYVHFANIKYATGGVVVVSGSMMFGRQLPSAVTVALGAGW